MVKNDPKQRFFNKHAIEWARNLENINIFPMAAHPSHPQSLKKQKPNFSFFSKTHLALDRFCKIKPQTAKMAFKTFINDSDMLNILQIIDFQQKIIGLDFMYHRIVKSWPHGLLRIKFLFRVRRPSLPPKDKMINMYWPLRLHDTVSSILDSFLVKHGK